MATARTDATGKVEMIPELLTWSSSIVPDRSFTREDILGSAAHVTMLRKVGLLEADDAKQLRGALLDLYDRAAKGELELGDHEEDVHMAVESLLTEQLGDVGKRLHTARSRNDQVALDLRLHVRDQAARTLADLAALIAELTKRAANEKDVILPAYTHRQRAMPVSAAFLIAAWSMSLLRAGETLALAVKRANESPLGSGACSGTSLPIDRRVVQELLGFETITANALDTVGDRDFALDWTWAGARVQLALSRLATDVIDFTTSEFAFLKIGDAVAAGSSMMPQKKNPDMFELVRGKTARAVGNLTHMLVLVKGLSAGYARDLQDDRDAVLSTGPLVRGAIQTVRLAFPHVTFDPARCLAAVSDGSTQATDLAEALVRQKGIPFRDAYKATGQFVHIARTKGVPLSSLSLEDARTAHPAFDADVLAALDPKRAVAAKKSQGGTAPERVEEQLAMLEAAAKALASTAATVPTLDALRTKIGASALA
jgi:argininosuccinate lyase